MKSILALAGDANAFGKKLEQFSLQKRPDGGTRVSEVLERLLDYTEKDVPTEQILNILRALFKVGDKLLLEEDKGRGLWGFGNDMRIGWVFFSLLRRLESQEKRYEVLEQAFSEGEAVTMIVNEVETLGQQHGKYGSQKRPEEQWFINSEQLQELENIALRKIKESASKGEIIQKARAVQILHRWRDWENEEVVKEYVAQTISSDEGLVAFLSIYLSQVSSLGMDDKAARYLWRLDPKSIDPWIDDLSKIYERCKSILKAEPEWLNEEGKIAVETFIRSFDLISKGKSIDNDLD
jgi:predicted KAP-like P-loop ATPase